jgi:hypothetical protein|tara:strand:- start:342 stop:623 length:282 start_codon:yes stop_codon:yes gene_type:complete
MSFSKMHCAKNPFKKAGVKHYTKDKKEYKGETHKMKDGSLHTGATHTKGSEELVHGPFKKTLNHTNTKCWPGKKKVGTKMSSTRPGVRVNDCK